MKVVQVGNRQQIITWIKVGQILWRHVMQQGHVDLVLASLWFSLDAYDILIAIMSNV